MSEVGRPVSKEERATWTMKKSISNVRLNIRTDSGGRDQFEAVKEDIKTSCFGLSHCFTEEQLNHLAKFVVDNRARLVAGIKQRVEHSLVELERRADEFHKLIHGK
jgi:hypothetical protein